jgi:hypothetical protein
MLGDAPAVGPRQTGEQAGHERRDPAPRLNPSEPRSDPEQQLRELHLPPIKVYAGGSSHREINLSLHKPG